MPKNGKVVSFGPKSTTATKVASGSPLLVDVEFGRGHTLYARSQGVGSGGPAGSPALPNTGALVEVNRHGTFTVVTDRLNQPTSLEFDHFAAMTVTSVAVYLYGSGGLEDGGLKGGRVTLCASCSSGGAGGGKAG